MQWEPYQRDYFVKLINEHGQFAQGYSSVSETEAHAAALADAATTKPPTYAPRREAAPKPTIDDLI